MNLYMIEACPFVHRVLLACGVRKISRELIQTITIDLDRPPPEMLKINPSGSVPTLIFSDGQGFHESLVIMEFLDSLTAAGPKLYGNTAKECAQTKVLWESANSILLSAVQQAIYSFGNVNSIRSANEKLKAGWEWLNTQLNKSEAPYIGGNDLNAVDIGLAPFLLRLKYAAEVHPSIPMPPAGSRAGAYLVRITEHCLSGGLFPDEQIMRGTTQKFALPHSLFKAVQDAPRTLIDHPHEALKLEAEQLSAWTVEEEGLGFCLKALFKFSSHEDAVNKLKWLHDAQEICDHHTSFDLRDFDSIEITLVTHEPRRGVTHKDLTMAKLLQTYFVKGQLPS